jgi:peroxiredoxin
MYPRFLRTFTAAFLLCAPLLACAADSPTLEPGAKAPDFSLPGIDDKTYSLADFADKEVLAVLFTCNHCPTAQAYEERVKQIVTDFDPRRFALVAISPNDPEAVRLDELGYSVHGDSFEDMKAHAALNGFNFPYLYDGETQKTAHAYGVVATPHLYVFDPERVLRYVGGIDDSENGKDIKQHYARDAIEALLAGQEPPVAKSRVFGCSTKWAEKKGGAAKSDEAWATLPVSMESLDADLARSLAANKTEQLRLINVWATWCGPCVAEFPELVKTYRRYEKRGLELVTISLDAPDDGKKAIAFLTREHAGTGPVTAVSLKAEGRATNNYHFTGPDKNALADALDPEWQGPVPHTLLVAPGGKVLYRKTGEIDPVELREAIVGYLGRTY